MLHRGGLRTVMCVCVYIGYAESIKTLAYCLTWQSWKKNIANINNILFFQILIPLFIELI